ncbi:imine reductase family protein [Embleya hyalina]|uniref:Oxidoreductase n=1 Tax=Embleya hyalina TaxID=516124 RepID=A0A401Z0D5_9ACTN|nr:hypothetical protein [Embleya hyalina]GCE00363.1 oxidoreductase [Embleya hyalina]
MMAGLAHFFAPVGADRVSAGEFLPFARGMLGILPDIRTRVAGAIDAGEYPGDQGNPAIEATGIEHAVDAATSRGLDVGVLEAVASVVGRAISRGHGADDFASTIEAIRNPARGLRAVAPAYSATSRASRSAMPSRRSRTRARPSRTATTGGRPTRL